MSISRRFRTLKKKASAAVAVAYGYAYDASRFYRYSGLFMKRRYKASRNAEITKFYHMIEKGLALPEPRPGFGRWAIDALGLQVGRAIDAGARDPELQFALDALDGYKRFNDGVGVEAFPSVTRTLERAGDKGLVPLGGPVLHLERADALPTDEYLGFIKSRHSVRQFAAGDVPDEVLRRAAEAAQSAPCVCNRQSSKVYFVRDPRLRADLLACQNGNRGFGDQVPVVAVVTTSLNHFLEAMERYQPWIDGGLFAMNLLLGIHAQGYGACCLNWSAEPAQDKRVRRLGLIPDEENIITMIAIGPLRDNYVVARSGRAATDDIMRIVG